MLRPSSSACLLKDVADQAKRNQRVVHWLACLYISAVQIVQGREPRVGYKGLPKRTVAALVHSRYFARCFVRHKGSNKESNIFSLFVAAGCRKQSNPGPKHERSGRSQDVAENKSASGCTAAGVRVFPHKKRKPFPRGCKRRKRTTRQPVPVRFSGRDLRTRRGTRGPAGWRRKADARRAAAAAFDAGRDTRCTRGRVPSPIAPITADAPTGRSATTVLLSHSRETASAKTHRRPVTHTP